jgi:hypothetical protein
LTPSGFETREGFVLPGWHFKIKEGSEVTFENPQKLLKGGEIV